MLTAYHGRLAEKFINCLSIINIMMFCQSILVVKFIKGNITRRCTKRTGKRYSKKTYLYTSEIMSNVKHKEVNSLISTLLLWIVCSFI